MNGFHVHRPVFLLVLLFSFLLFLTGAFSGDGGGKRSPQKSSALNGFLININNIRLPLDNQGVLGDYDPGSGAGGFYDGKIFLFSGGFLLSGHTNSTLWANGVFSAARIQDYQPGPVGSDQDDPRNKVYVVRSMDIPFGDSWQEWKNAVALGADFYDGDGDGIYNPSDLNYDGKWNSNEDRPDLIGDLTAWCVYNDAVPRVMRRMNNVDPQGIEIHQTVFGFASRENIGNMLFVRYRLINKGTKADHLDSVYFSVFTDPDLGDYTDDLLGCDTTLEGGYVYNPTADALYGVNAPVFLASLLQGPAVYIPGVTFTDSNGNGIFDSGEPPLTEAYNVKGLVQGIDTLPGAKNLGMTSFMQIMQSQSGQPLGTVWEYRNWQKGLNYNGVPIDPCTWTFGTGTTDPDCINWNPKYMYSGDPVAGNGWRNTVTIDQRKMISTGAFSLHKNQPVDIVAAYIVGRSPVSSLLSVNTAKELAKAARSVFNKNFEGPARPDEFSIDARTGNGFIDLTWNTSPLVTYRSLDTILGIDRRVQGFYVTAYRTNSEAALIPGVVNAKIISSYAVNNSIHDIYQTQQNGGLDIRFKRPEAEYLLDSALHADPAQGRIRLRITADPFDGIPLIKGKEYFFALTTYTLNHKSIVNKQTTTYGPPGDYLDATGAAIDEYSTSIIRVVYDTDLYEPAPDIGKGNKTSGFATQGNVAYLVVNDEELTGDSYTVEFKSDTSQFYYSSSYSLKNNRTGEYLISDSKDFNFDTTNYSGRVTDGFILKVKSVAPLPSVETRQTYIPASNQWFRDLNVLGASLGAYYAGRDITVFLGSEIFNSRSSRIMKANRLRTIEVRFGQPGKAYRYLNGFAGNTISARGNSYKYAAGISPADTFSSRGGPVGKFGLGFVDVPFQVWVKDSVYGEERQLAVAFVEKTSKLNWGNPDGNWFPGTDVWSSREAIIVFDADYDASGSQIVYTGGVFGTDSAWADLMGYQFPPGATTVTDEQKRIAASPLFDAMYVIGLSALTPTSTFTPGDILRVPVVSYPYTDDDRYTFSTRKGGDLTFEEKKELFEKVNVFPNPFFANNTRFSYENLKTAEESYVTFTNLPETVTIKIYTVSGALIKTLTESDKMDGASSPFLRWDLKNQSGSRVASGMYLAIVTAPGYGEKLLKLGIIQQAGSK